MELKRHITTTTDVLGNKYLVIKFVSDNIIDDIIDEWVYEADNSEEEVQRRFGLIANQVERDNGSHHITIIPVMDMKKAGFDKIKKVIGKEVTITLCGIGKAVDEKKGNEAHFIVVDSQDLNELREEFGLKPHDFHITIGFSAKDVFGKSKGKDSIYHEID